MQVKAALARNALPRKAHEAPGSKPPNAPDFP